MKYKKKQITGFNWVAFRKNNNYKFIDFQYKTQLEKKKV